MLYNDRKIELDNRTALADYLASFWNPKAVKKVSEARKAASKHNFKSDDEFEEYLLSGEYKNSPLVDAIIKMKKLESENNQRLKSAKETINKRKNRNRLHGDLTSIQSTLKKFD